MITVKTHQYIVNQG